ncbi:MAG TPA: NADH-quinone oxidoreductase subunit C [Vicinamibacterales bacterium]|nr:NADH-quinone oxidoreductase subunit C [Vicinamibacterales bacterium]
MSTGSIDTSPVLDTLRAAVPDAAIDGLPSIDMPTFVVGREHLLEVCRTLRDHPALQFAFLADVIGVDRLPAEPRFEVVYHAACLGPASGAGAPARRVRFKVQLAADDGWVPSVVGIWPTANWLEREIFDLLGLVFDGHPDLRRVLMPDDWQGHPLRKDYPVQIRKDTATWSPLQVSVEEFAENMRRRREEATRQAQSPHGDA